jgi:phage terminase large subunit
LPSHQDRNVRTYWHKQLARIIARSEISDADKCARYRNDPIGFFRDILGIYCWSKQRELLEAVRDNRRVSCVSGHKVGKTFAVAGIALWLYCSYSGARVIFTAPNENHVNNVLWEAIRRLVKRAKRLNGIVIPGTEAMHVGARAGIKDDDRMSEIRGIVAQKPEALAGVAGARVFLLVDEASGIEDKAYEPLQSNIAGAGSKMVLIGNPTRADGTFYESHHTRRKTPENPIGYYAMSIASTDSPNVTGEWRVCQELVETPNGPVWQLCQEEIDGLATQEYVDQEAADYGEGSPTYAVRVSGSFQAAEDLKLFPAGRLEESCIKWPTTEETGRLHIGIDPAGPGEGGDNKGFCLRRGLRVVSIYEIRSMSPEMIYATAQGHVDEWYANHSKADPPVIALDREGPVGKDVLDIFRENEDKGRYILIPVRASDVAKRQPKIYHLTRDELWVSASDWMRAGGTIPPDRELIRQLQVAKLFQRQGGYFGQVKVTLKSDMIEALRRSPDKAEAFILSCWEPGWLMGGGAAKAERAAPRPDPAVTDVYAEVLAQLESNGTMDPYHNNGGSPY